MRAKGRFGAVGAIVQSMAAPERHVALLSDCVYLANVAPYDA